VRSHGQTDKADDRSSSTLNYFRIYIFSLVLLSAAVPTIRPFPKCANSADRLFYNLSSVVVHAVGYFIFLSTDAQSNGCDLTIEVIYRLLITLQSYGYVFEGVFNIQADNHTDNKTPAVLFFLAYLVSINVFHVCDIAFLLVGHGHLCADQRHSVNARSLSRPSELPIVPSRFKQALRNGYREEGAKPYILDVDGVHEWSNFLDPFMHRIDLQRLACSGGSGEAQYEYIIQRYGEQAHEVGMTYKKYASEPEIYPRKWNIGSEYLSEAHGPGSVVSTSFSALTSSWTSEIFYHNGYVEKIDDPPQPIFMFPDARVPTGSPSFEAMAISWPKQIHAIQKNIKNCENHLGVFTNEVIPGVQDEWIAFFDNQKLQISSCLSNPTSPWCKESSALVAISPTPAPRARVEQHHRAPSPSPPVPFDIDPVTHSAFTPSERAILQRAERLSLVPGTHVVLRLKFGAAVPVHHKLPFCLAIIPPSFNAATHIGDELVNFCALFSKGSDLTSTWTSENENSRILAPLRSVLVSGIELTASRKLSASSTKKIKALVSGYDLEV
jgi:hypothetical protein